MVVEETSPLSFNYLEVGHTDLEDGRKGAKSLLEEEIDIPSFRPELKAGRWRARYLQRSLTSSPEQQRFMKEILKIVSSLRDVTTQRAVYYVLRGTHPDWKYKGHILDHDFFYQKHFVTWLMEKLQLHMGYTMQSIGIWAAPRGYLAGDGMVKTSRGVSSPLRARPALGFDLVDEGSELKTHARKVIHFEKDAGMENLISGDYPRYVEAVFSTSQGQLTEAANKFLRNAEDLGLDLYSVHDGDAAGIQMQLLHGLSSKNNCYMPEDFYPSVVVPLGFYPSIGTALGLPAEKVDPKEHRLFDNLNQMARVKDKDPRFIVDMQPEVDVLVKKKQKWEFQALNAMHERAPQVFIIEGLRIHGDELKHVPKSSTVKEDILREVRDVGDSVVNDAVKKKADELLEEMREEVERQLRSELESEIDNYQDEVEEYIQTLSGFHQQRFRERVKAIILKSPRLYYHEAMGRAAREMFNAEFTIDEAVLSFSELLIEDVHVTSAVSVQELQRTVPITRTQLVDAINTRVLPSKRVRDRVVGKIRTALERRFGDAEEKW